MKTWVKILMWFGVGSGIGFFAGYGIGSRKGMKAGQEQTAEEFNNMLDEVYKKDNTAKENAEKIREDYAGGNENRYGREPENEQTYISQTEEPEMPEETPVIGDEDDVETSPAIELISEEEFYENSGGYAQEELVWYMLDEVLFNKDTQTRLDKDEIHKSIGYGTTDIFDTENAPETVFVKNHLLQYMFRIDAMDAAFTDREIEEADTDDDEDE